MKITGIFSSILITLIGLFALIMGGGVKEEQLSDHESQILAGSSTPCKDKA